ncbi:MAG: SDR family NAD(P)-dependent oxidoreductase, partial [Armatimonadota bacterium]
REIVRLLATEGVQVCAVARRLDRLEELAAEFPGKVFPLVNDVTEVETVPDAFIESTRLAGGLDMIVYASGVMATVGETEFDTGKDLSMIRANLDGMVAWLNEAATRMQNTKHGRLVCIGSVAGDRGRYGQPVYNACKAFQATYMEALRNRIARYGVKVVTVKPGPTSTEMTAHLPQKGMMDAKVAAEKIIRLSNRTGEHYLKFSHRVIFAIIRHFPSWVFRRLKV